MYVKDFMTVNVYFVKENASAWDAALLMKKYNIGFVPVCDKDGRLLGVVSDRDLLLHMVSSKDSAMENMPVKEIMSMDVASVSPDTNIHDAAMVFSEKAVHRLPVTQNHHLVGILSLSDLSKRKVLLAEVGYIHHAISLYNYVII